MKVISIIKFTCILNYKIERKPIPVFATNAVLATYYINWFLFESLCNKIIFLHVISIYGHILHTSM